MYMWGRLDRQNVRHGNRRVQPIADREPVRRGVHLHGLRVSITRKIFTIRNGVHEGYIFSCVCMSVWRGSPCYHCRPVQTSSFGDPRSPGHCRPPDMGTPPRDVQSCSIAAHASIGKRVVGLWLKGFLVAIVAIFIFSVQIYFNASWNVHFRNDFACFCAPFKTGRLCDVTFDPCEPTNDHCRNNATCSTNDNRSFVCQCAPGNFELNLFLEKLALTCERLFR